MLLVAALVWLVLLVFPMLYLVVVSPPLSAVVPALLGLCALLVAYVRAVVVIARDGPPRLRLGEFAVLAVSAVVLPLVFGGGWFGGTVFLAALVGLSWPAPRALVGVALATALAVVTGLASAAPIPQLLSVPMLTVLAGVVVIVVVRQVVLGRELSRVSAEAERLRLARELHDSVKQHAFVAAMELGAARGRSDAVDPTVWPTTTPWCAGGCARSWPPSRTWRWSPKRPPVPRR